MGEKIDRRTTDTKERIIHEALQLYKQGGIAAVKLNDITRVLHVTRAALYNHFPEGKEQIFLEAFSAMVHEIDRRLTDVINSVPDTYHRLRELLRQVSRTSSTIDLDIFFLQPEELSQSMKDRMEEIMQPLLDKLSLILQEGMARGDLRTVDLSLAFLSFGMLIKQIKKLEEHKSIDLPCELRIQQENEVLIDQLLDLWLTGMANRERKDFLAGADYANGLRHSEMAPSQS